MRLLRASLLFGLVSLLPACEQEICSVPPHSAVDVTVVDARGNPIRDARVTYSHEGGPEYTAPCAERADASTDCALWSVGTSPGEFRITVTSADGTRSAQRTVSVDSLGCDNHLTASVEITLPD